ADEPGGAGVLRALRAAAGGGWAAGADEGRGDPAGGRVNADRWGRLRLPDAEPGGAGADGGALPDHGAGAERRPGLLQAGPAAGYRGVGGRQRDRGAPAGD